jgi:hypothetical protein
MDADVTFRTSIEAGDATSSLKAIMRDGASSMARPL